MRKIKKKLGAMRRKRKAESNYQDNSDDELDDMLCNVGDGDDNDYESSINNAEEGDNDKDNGISK